MARYTAGGTTAGVNTANTGVANLVGSASERLAIREISVGVNTAPTTAPLFALARSTARGTQTSTVVTGFPMDSGDAASTAVGVDTVWSVAPTFTNTNRMKVGGLATTAGGWWVWQFYDYPLYVPATAANGIILFNINASGSTLGQFAWNFTWDE